MVYAIDCGIVINPNIVEELREGGIEFGLMAELKKGITNENGRVQQSNFHDYPLLRMNEMAVVEVHILSQDPIPFGVGEMGIPPTAPSVLNAVYTATGKYINHLPIQPDDLL